MLMIMVSDSEFKCFEFLEYPMANCNSCSKILFWPPCSRSSLVSIIILNTLQFHTCKCTLTLYIYIYQRVDVCGSMPRVLHKDCRGPHIDIFSINIIQVLIHKLNWIYVYLIVTYCFKLLHTAYISGHFNCHSWSTFGLRVV